MESHRGAYIYRKCLKSLAPRTQFRFFREVIATIGGVQTIGNGIFASGGTGAAASESSPTRAQGAHVGHESPGTNSLGEGLVAGNKILQATRRTLKVVKFELQEVVKGDGQELSRASLHREQDNVRIIKSRVLCHHNVKRACGGSGRIKRHRNIGSDRKEL
ncbi:MAG: hypothetical protein Q9207_003020 [Kuettlingeria erythrocarpa]